MDFSASIAEFLDRIRITPAGKLLERADELRNRLLRAMIVFAVIFGGVIGFAKQMFAILKMPLLHALPEGKATLHFTSPIEVFVSYVKVGFLAAAVVAAPYAFHQLFRFIEPALPPANRRAIIPLFIASLVLFVAGGAFCFFAILPTALEFLLGMGTEVAKPLITVDDYISLLVLMILGFGAVFQLPLVLIILERLEVVSVDTFAKNRGAMLVGILAVAAVATPTPDPFSQLAMATPMYLMFEGAILIMRWMGRTDAAT